MKKSEKSTSVQKKHVPDMDRGGRPRHSEPVDPTKKPDPHRERPEITADKSKQRPSDTTQKPPNSKGERTDTDVSRGEKMNDAEGFDTDDDDQIF